MSFLSWVGRLLGGTGDGVAGVIFRGGATSFLLAVVSLGLGFISHVLLSRAIGVNDYGLYSIALGWCLILAVPAMMGMDYTILRFAPVYLEGDDHVQLRQLSNFVTVILIASTTATAIFIGSIAWLSPQVVGITSVADVTWMILLIGCASCPS